MIKLNAYTIGNPSAYQHGDGIEECTVGTMAEGRPVFKCFANYADAENFALALSEETGQGIARIYTQA